MMLKPTPLFAMTETVCQVADALTSEDRIKDYGHPAINLAEIAAMWSIILRTKVSAEQVALCNIATKVCRQMHARKRDNLIDICGYAKVADTIIQYEEKSQTQGQDHEAEACQGQGTQAGVQSQKDQSQQSHHGQAFLQRNVGL